MVAIAKYSSDHRKGFDPDTLYAGGLVASIMVLADLIHTHFFSEVRGNYHRLEATHEKTMPVALDAENEIPHARLAHFASQIGHWHISSMVKNHNR